MPYIPLIVLILISPMNLFIPYGGSKVFYLQLVRHDIAHFPYIVLPFCSAYMHFAATNSLKAMRAQIWHPA